MDMGNRLPHTGYVRMVDDVLASFFTRAKKRAGALHPEYPHRVAAP
ncbi:hypothetical protein [Arthrobacter sp. SLBN-122]|nr:hypothetical protein [Arthrobacter sp. SLBN-122]